MKVLKQAVGIDISKDELEVKFKELNSVGLKIKGSRKFSNTQKGFEQLLEWGSIREKTEQIFYGMEATGIYHENLLYFLYSNGKKVCVELPQRIKYFAKSKGVKTKNDKIDSGIIADYCIERNPRTWQPPSREFMPLRDLSQAHNALKEAKVAASNRLHAVMYSHEKNQNVIDRLHAQILIYESQLDDTEKDMKTTIKKDDQLYNKIKKIETIKGVRMLTIIKVIAETGGFYLFNNINQLISYAGLDVIENQSGKHNGKTRISKKGNSNLRTTDPYGFRGRFVSVVSGNFLYQHRIMA